MQFHWKSLITYSGFWLVKIEKTNENKKKFFFKKKKKKKKKMPGKYT